MSPGDERGVMSDRPSLAVAREACERLGYDASVETAPLASPTDGATPIAGDPAPVEATVLDGTDPHEAVAVVARAASRDRVALLVAPDEDAGRRLRDLLADPPVLRAESDTGARGFHTGADRVHLDEGGLALHVTRDGPPHPTPAFEWDEEPEPEAGDERRERTGTDRRRLVLAADGEVVTRLDGVGALACPGPSRERFTHHYRREDDRLFHVYDAGGTPAGVFAGVRAMRERGFHPVPAPVVPEHLFHDAERPPRRCWAVLGPDGGLVTDTGAVE